MMVYDINMAHFMDVATDAAKVENHIHRRYALRALEVGMVLAGFTKADMQKVADFYKDARAAWLALKR